MTTRNCFSTFLLLVLFYPVTFAQTIADDYLAVSETVSYYLEGGTYNNYDRLSKAFHEDATMQMIGKPYETVNALAFFKKGMKPGPKQDRKTSIQQIDLYGNAAVAKLHIDYTDTRFVDHMHLTRFPEGWKITSKVFAVVDLTEVSDEILSTSETAVLDVLHRWKMVFLNQDADELERILGDNWTYAGGADGKLGTKMPSVEGARNQQGSVSTVNIFEVTTRSIAEDVVLVSGKEAITGEDENGDPFSFKARFTDVFQKINGRWQAILTHSSPREE
ncbi:MAG: nuclear transport factor 2 family protein [Bacteroidota bacterium]